MRKTNDNQLFKPLLGGDEVRICPFYNTNNQIDKKTRWDKKCPDRWDKMCPT